MTLSEQGNMYSRVRRCYVKVNMKTCLQSHLSCIMKLMLTESIGDFEVYDAVVSLEGGL